MSHRPKIVIGRDTRLSGQMLENALISGICSMGGDVFCAGIFPTPGVAHVTRHLNANAGIVISASHNPFYDNGIKFFNGKGFKLSDEAEAEIEALILDGMAKDRPATHHEIGTVHQIPDAEKIYSDFLKAAVSRTDLLDGYTIAMDCSQGATFSIAPRLFSELGARVLPIAIAPDGRNINEECGSQHPDLLSKKVNESNADMGVAFDGDGDRLIAVDESGTILSGDQVLAIFAHFLSKNGMLENRTAVSTIMSNIGLGKALASMNVNHIMSDVGDRYVMEQMIASGAILGGEDSGHMILLNRHTTGDGILAALQLLTVMRTENKPLSALAGVMTVFPQTLMNVAVQHKPDLETIPEIRAAIQAAEAALEGNGRVLVRYSGTQPVCRVMVEAATMEDATHHCNRIVSTIKKHLN
jgi:phosphoglucosamine mutase